jgi:uncharacterized protein YcfJ
MSKFILQVMLAAVASAHVGSAQLRPLTLVRERDSGSQSTATATWPLRTAFPRTMIDSGAQSSRRASVTGGVLGAVIGGLGAAGYILNAKAYHCVTSGPPCPKKNYVLLHTVTIAAGAAAGAFIGSRIGRWIGKRL